MKRFLLVALLAALTSGCGDSQESTHWIGGEVNGHPKFRLPGSVYALKNSQDDKALTGRAWWIEPSSWKPKGWSLWVASNVYSDYETPKNDLEYLRHGFNRADPSWKRSAQESQFIGAVHQWFVENDVDIEVNFVGYDYVPSSIGRTNDVDKGYWLTHNNEPCEKAFRLCISNYFISPADRFSGGKRMSFKEWIAPYLTIAPGERGQGQLYVINSVGGMEDERSAFYDNWPTMVFLVNPSGEVVRAWLPHTNNVATLRTIQGAVVHDIGGKYKNLEISDKNLTPSPPATAYYGEYFIETQVGKVLDVFKEIMGAK